MAFGLAELLISKLYTLRIAAKEKFLIIKHAKFFNLRNKWRTRLNISVGICVVKELLL